MPNGDAHLFEPLRNSAAHDSKLACHITSGAAGQILLDQIVAIDSVSFHGFVYNLETATGWYLAENIVAHNCRCSEGLTFGEE